MQGNYSTQHFIDYFKLFKVYDLKKIEKTGLVKIVMDQALARKVISVQGNISTSNFITFSTANCPNIAFSERYLYVQGHQDPGKSFCLQIAYTLGNKQFKAVYSTLYKLTKKHLENIVHLPLSLVTGKWNIAVIDLYQLGMHFGFKPQEMKMIFRVTSVEVRASSKVKGIFQSDYLFTVDKMPKEMTLPLKKDQNYFDKYHYFVETTDVTCLKCAGQVKAIIQKEVTATNEAKSQSKQKKKQNKSKNIQKSEIVKPKQASSTQVQITTKQKTKMVSHNSKKNINTTLPPMSGKSKQDKIGTSKAIQISQQQNQPEEIEIQPPKPQATITIGITCVEGFTISRGTLTTIESFLLRPNFTPVHKSIQLVCECDSYNTKVLLGYCDGSICLWDTIRKVPLNYFMTELLELRVMEMDAHETMLIIGLDKMKREVINIVSNNSVIFRQISNYNIIGALLINKTNFQQGIVTFGFQNIRLWRVNNDKGIIQGSNLYLGHTNRKVKYTDGIVLRTDDYLVFVTDSNGFITTISITQSKMIQSVKVDTCTIDHIVHLKHKNTNLGRALISNELGILRVLNLQKMEILQEFNLNNRVKEIKEVESTGEIVLTHFNKSIGSLNLQSSLYSFIVRSHTASIIKLVYNQHLNKVISISKDSTIRIWQYVIGQGALPFRLQEQYEFVITGEDMVDVVSGSEGKSEDMCYAVVGSSTGKLRQIHLQHFAINQQVALQTGPMSLCMSRNGKYIICTYRSGNSYLLDGNLTPIHKYIRHEGDKKRLKNWKNGFNRVNKEYFIQNFEQQKLQFYSLKDKSVPLFFIDANQSILQIEYIGNKVYVIGDVQMRIYDRQTIIQVINLGKDIQNVLFTYPLLCFSSGQKLTLKLMATSIQQTVNLPEPVSAISIHYNEQKQDGYIFCAGIYSFAIYVISFQMRNMQFMLDQALLVHRLQQKQQQITEQLQISFSLKGVQSLAIDKRSNKETQFQQPPKQLKKLYAQQEQLYEQVKQYILPKQFQEKPEEDQQQAQEVQIEDEYQKRIAGLHISLNYGFEMRQDAKNERDIGSFYWLSANNSLLLLTGNGKTIMQHFFTVPVRHKLISFPSTITSISLSLKSQENIRYLAVCVHSLIKIYNVFDELSYMRTLDSLGSAFPNNSIFQTAITVCNRYLLTLSYNQVVYDAKLYIHVIQIGSGSVVSSSYLSLLAPKNKHKNNQLKEIRQYKLIINPYRTGLQFVLYHSNGLFYFYRITSMFTLQTMQLEEMVSLCSDKISNLTSACFISVGQLQCQDSVLVLGSQNGSIVFVDCRTASIMIACVGLIPNTPILSISFQKSQDDQSDKLILFNNSTSVTVYNLFQGINSILASFDHQSNSLGSQNQTKRIITLDGEVTARSNIENNGQQLLITKCGSLWLVDYQDFVTVKVLNIHTDNINQADILNAGKDCYMLTCSDDGSAKLSNLINLQQVFQIYKPRRQAKAFSMNDSFTLIGFGDEVYIYKKIELCSENSSDLVTLGSFKVEGSIICISNIPTTGNYYILTENEVIIVYVSSREVKNKSDTILKSVSRNFSETGTIRDRKCEVSVQIQKITDVQNPLKIVVNESFAPYDQFAVISKPGKVAIWLRKCLKRNANPIEQLTNVHELTYYLIDANCRNTSESSYVNFIDQNQYLLCILQEGLIQIRNYRQHAIVRQINTNLTKLSTVLSIGTDDFMFYLADQHGYLYIMNENGLLIQRLKIMECRVTGLKLWTSGNTKRLLAYGGKYAVIVNNINT